MFYRHADYQARDPSVGTSCLGEQRLERSVRWTTQKRRARGSRWCGRNRDLKVIPWIFEQYSVRYDQLAELLGRWPGKEPQQAGRLGRETVRKLARRWKHARVVDYEVLLVRQPPWYWVTPQGQTLMGLAGRPWTPTIRGHHGLERRYYATQVRLWLERTYPEAAWRSERLLWQSQGARSRKGEAQDPIPDAEVQFGRRRIAIEVELTAKTEERWQEILAERAARYDQVWYFTSAQLHRDLGRALDAVEPGIRARFSLSLVNEAAYRLERPSP